MKKLRKKVSITYSLFTIPEIHGLVQHLIQAENFASNSQDFLPDGWHEPSKPLLLAIPYVMSPGSTNNTLTKCSSSKQLF